LSETQVIEFTEGKLSEQERTIAEKHLVMCADCLDDVAFVLQSRDRPDPKPVRFNAPVVPAGPRAAIWGRWPFIAAAAGLLFGAVLITRYSSPPLGDGEVSEPTVESVRGEHVSTGVLKVEFPRENMVVTRSDLEVAWRGPANQTAEVWLTDAAGRLVWSAATGRMRIRVPDGVALEPGRLYYVSVRLLESRDRVIRSKYVGFRVRTP
jgi:hypothetical protein